MFDSKQTLTGRLADAVDLVIDFATLGEFGLEPIAEPNAPCQARHRPGRGKRLPRRSSSISLK